MDVEIVKEIETAITTIGFPIFMCWLMWTKITDSDEKQTELLTKLISAIDNLTEYIKGGDRRD